MSEFGKWSKSQIIMVKSEAKSAFEAGQQSRQGEVDKLQTEIDELQKRIDEARKSLFKRGKTKEYRIDKTSDILKGNKDEN